MPLNIEKTIEKLSRYFPYPNIGTSEGVDYWKNRLLYSLILSLIFFGFLAYIPSVYVAIKEQLWIIVAIDSVVYGLIFILGISKKMSPKTKIVIILSTVYFLGCTLLVILGPHGAGLIWLFLFPVLAGLLLDLKAVIVTTFINIFTLGILSIPVVLHKPDGLGLLEYETVKWLVNIANFIAINFLVSTSLSLIISRLNESLLKEKKISGLLKKEREKLKIEKLHAEESDRLKTAFLANMSHEIRTPMNGILGFTDLMKNHRPEGEKQQKYLDLIQECGERMLHIINDLIDISKIEADQIELFMKKVNLNQLMNNLCHLFDPQATSKGLKLICKTGLEDDRSIIMTDETKFTQILTNLVNNALKFTKEGKIEFGYLKKQKVLEFYVRDTGIGIKPEMSNIIFERFRRVDGASNHTINGTGLGLAISKAYIEKLGGKIWLESKFGEGSTFYVTLPFNPVLSKREAIENEVLNSAVNY